MPTSNSVDIFLESNKYLREKKTPPYYLEAKLYDLSFVLTEKEKYIIVADIVEHDKAAAIFRYYKRNRILANLFNALDNLAAVPQRKSKSKNAFEHVMNVIEQIEPRSDYLIFRWVAILHDLGKHKSFYQDHNFTRHATYSCHIAEDLMENWPISHAQYLLALIRAHMWPLDYQRNPNWTEPAIVNFIKRCGGQEISLDTIRFSIYDKKAENDNPEFLKPLEELLMKVKKVSV